MFSRGERVNESALESMDRMYRYQRYFYDLTRKFYLLGRDRLIREIGALPGDKILELGCGTARNLAILAAQHPKTDFYGLDASAEMLKTAARNIRSLKNVELRTLLADQFSVSDFGLDKTFDIAFFSYAISIIPPWRESILNALRNLRPGGRLLIVDFYDQKDLPEWFRWALKSWLSKFHVAYPTELLPFLESLDGVKVSVTPLYRRYSVLIEIEKSV